MILLVPILITLMYFMFENVRAAPVPHPGSNTACLVLLGPVHFCDVCDHGDHHARKGFGNAGAHPDIFAAGLICSPAGWDRAPRSPRQAAGHAWPALWRSVPALTRRAACVVFAIAIVNAVLGRARSIV